MNDLQTIVRRFAESECSWLSTVRPSGISTGTPTATPIPPIIISSIIEPMLLLDVAGNPDTDAAEMPLKENHELENEWREFLC